MKQLIALGAIGLGIMSGYWVMMNGWGIEPQSWPVIIAGTFAGMICSGVALIASK